MSFYDNCGSTEEITILDQEFEVSAATLNQLLDRALSGTANDVQGSGRKTEGKAVQSSRIFSDHMIQLRAANDQEMSKLNSFSLILPGDATRGIHQLSNY